MKKLIMGAAIAASLLSVVAPATAATLEIKNKGAYIVNMSLTETQNNIEHVRYEMPVGQTWTLDVSDTWELRVRIVAGTTMHYSGRDGGTLELHGTTLYPSIRVIE